MTIGSTAVVLTLAACDSEPATTQGGAGSGGGGSGNMGGGGSGATGNMGGGGSGATGNMGGGGTGGVASTCSDAIQNQDETATDCGGATCGPCADGLTCLVNADCQSGDCSGGVCAAACTQTASGPSRGSAIAISEDDSLIVSVNRDLGTLTIADVDFSGGDPTMTLVDELDLGAGADSEPWQVVMNPCGTKAWVVLRKAQQIVRVDNLDTVPVVGPTFATGSEPTGIAITPNGTEVYVANWVDGTISVVNGLDMALVSTVDLNQALIDTGLLDANVTQSRPSLAHPRAIAITNDGDADDFDETVVVTEWFGQRTGPQGMNGANADTNHQGVLYTFDNATFTTGTIDLPPVLDTLFNSPINATGLPQTTGCFPNQIGSVTLKGNFAYVTSTCASPEGPIGVYTKPLAPCPALPQTCASLPGYPVTSSCNIATNTCTQNCTTDADCGPDAPAGTCAANVCGPNGNNAKTTTHPALSIVNLANGTATTTAIDKNFDLLPANAMNPKKVPHLPTDIGFINDFAYISASGADGLFRVNTAGDVIVSVGSMTKNFIDLHKPMNDTLIRLPIGVATAHAQAYGFVNNDGSRDITAVEFNAQAIAGDQVADFRILQAAALPAAGSQAEAVLKGKRFFGTGIGRWSLRGEGWGSCAACHIDGLTDNVTWFFGRGPRQSTSLDGSFASLDPKDQRIFNWTAVFDEVADFELNTRGTSGGVGAIVNSVAAPINNGQRINLAAEVPPQQGLQGATGNIADPSNPLADAHAHSVIGDWLEVTEYMRTIRSPRRPTNLVAADVQAGQAIFSGAGQGNCVGCHGGAKWTISTVFWPVGDQANTATGNNTPQSIGFQDWLPAAQAANFPAALFPVVNPAVDPHALRTGNAANEQIQCILRPVGTFGISPMGVGVAELRQDMTTPAQGNASTGRGYNPPSLLGLQIGAPFFHAGNARSLEELLDAQFAAHHQSAIAQVFSPSAAQKAQLVQYLLSIDEDEAPFAMPALSNTGGSFCVYM